MTQATIDFSPTRMGRCHAAKLENSSRLQQVLAALKSGQGRMTGGAIYAFCMSQYSQHHGAIHSDITELRANGISIGCERNAEGYYEYWIDCFSGANA